MKQTNRSKILAYMKEYGFINKRIAAFKHWSFSLGDHIMQLRKEYEIETVMLTNPQTGTRYAVYKFYGKI